MFARDVPQLYIDVWQYCTKNNTLPAAPSVAVNEIFLKSGLDKVVFTRTVP